MRGAALSLDGEGKPIIACTSTTDEGISRIVPTLKEGRHMMRRTFTLPLLWLKCASLIHFFDVTFFSFAYFVYMIYIMLVNVLIYKCVLVKLYICRRGRGDDTCARALHSYRVWHRISVRQEPSPACLRTY